MAQRAWWRWVAGWQQRARDRQLEHALLETIVHVTDLVQVHRCLEAGANADQSVIAPSQSFRRQSLFNLAVGAGRLDLALVLKQAGAHADQESVGMLARNAHAWRDAVWLHASSLHQLVLTASLGARTGMGPIQQLEPAIAHPGAWMGAKLALACATEELDWWEACRLDSDIEEAAARVIGVAAPGFLDLLGAAQVARGQPHGRPPLPAMSQAEMDVLLAKTVDRTGETLDEVEHKERVMVLLTRGADPNTASARTFFGERTSLVGAAIADWRPWLFEALIEHGGRVEARAFTWLARSMLSLIDPLMLIGQASGRDVRLIRQQLLVDAMNAVQAHAVIDWDSVIPPPGHPYFAAIQDAWGPQMSESTPLRLLDALAEPFPAFEALRMERSLEHNTAQATGRRGTPARL